MYKVDPRQVEGVVLETAQMLEGRGFHQIEAIIGLAEVIGRSIVDIGSTRVQMDELEEVVADHIKRTIRIGAHAKGKGPLQQVG